AADQRAGRAGRTAPGVCLRLWPESSHAHRPVHELPEIQRLDLAPTLVQLHAEELSGFDDLTWLDAPPPAAVARAQRLLHELALVDEAQHLTADGRAVAAVPAHPRLGRMLLEAARLCCLGRAIVWAAIIGERDIFRREVDHQTLRRYLRPGDPESDLIVRERALAEARSVRFSPRVCADLQLDAAACREVDHTIGQLRRWAIHREMPLDPGSTDDLLIALLHAYADHIAMKPDPEKSHILIPNRKGVAVGPASVVRDAGPLVAVAVDQVGQAGAGKAVTSLASAVTADLLEYVHGDRLYRATVLRWNEEVQAVEQVEQLRFGELTLGETARPATEPPAVRAAAADMLVERIRAGDLKLARWNDEVEQFIERSRCLREWLEEDRFLAYDPDELRVILHEIVNDATRYSEVRERPVIHAVQHAMDYADLQRVESLAPTRLVVPSGYRMPVVYRRGSTPRGRAKIQQLYGCDDTPRVARGTVALTLEILGPNGRAVQITSDLKSFWNNTYPELRKDLARRYPKHDWR
ncbi:MAG: ATP-dependent helicase C-terminal domain-containing protein, partial [Phycisphaeraceae bacterium]